MEAKLFEFVPDEEQRLQRIQNPVESLRSGKTWSRFEPHLKNWASTMQQLKKLRYQPNCPTEPEQNEIKQDLLLISSHSGMWEIVEKLFSTGVDPNCTLKDTGQTPLQLAALLGNARTFKSLLSATAIDVNAKDSLGNTALMCAAQRGCLAVVEMLLKQPNLDAVAMNMRGYNALDYAIANGHDKVMLELHKRCPGLSIKYRLEKLYNFYKACCFEACENSWEKVLMYLCEQGMPLNIRRPEFKTDLVFAACLYQQNEMLELLQLKNVNLDTEDTVKATPLFIACQYGNLPAVQLLCDAKCEINKRDLNGLTPMYMAASNGHIEVVKYLKKQGGDLNVITESGESLLDAAIDSHSLKLFRYLWNKSIMKETADWESLAHRSAKQLAVEILKEILTKSPELLKAKDSKHNTLLLVACHRGCKPVLELLKKLGADFSHANRKGKTPALLLSSVGPTAAELLKLVKEAGGQLDIPNRKGATALLRASRFNNFSALQFLADSGCRLDIRDRQGRTAAFFAAQNGNFQMLSFLKSQRAPLDVDTIDGMTALLVAAQNNSLECIQLLLDSGMCQIGKVNLQRQGIALFFALNGNIEVTNSTLTNYVDLYSRDDNGNTPALNACLGGHLTVLKALVDKKCELDDKNYKGESGLYYAARYNFPAVMRFLLEKKCDLDACDDEGNTPFMIAAKYGHVDLLKMLHEHKCDINIRSIKTGRNALHLACDAGHAICVSYLLNIKCNVQQTDKSGATSLMLACQNCSLESVDCILKHISTLKNDKSHAFVDIGLESCVHYAAKSGNETILRRIAELNLPMDEPNANGETPLILAASSSCYRSVEFLLNQYKASIACVDKMGQSAVHKAAANGNLAVVKLLHNYAGLDTMDRPDYRGMTPLLLAAENDNENVFTFLKVECKCNVLNVNSCNENAALLAAKGGSVEVIRQLMEFPDLFRTVANDGQSCLSILLQSRDLQDCSELVKKLTGANYQYMDCNVALQVAASHGRIRALRSLLEMPECNVNSVDSEGNSALHLAAGAGHDECVRVLLDRIFINPQATEYQNKMGQTALHLSCSAGNRLCVDVLLRKHQFCASDVLNLQDNNGDTAVICAVRAAVQKEKRLSGRTVEALLNKGARLDTVNRIGLTAWRLAFAGHREDLLGLMEHFAHQPVTQQKLQDTMVATNNPNFIRDAIQSAILSRNLAFVKKNWSLLLEAPESLVGSCSDGSHLLHACVTEDLSEMVTDLINHGCNVNCQDNKGRTPFFTAVDFNRTDMAKWLHKSFKCDINIPDSTGITPLMLAIRKHSYQLIDWLLTNGAKPNAKDQKGRNALHSAAKTGSLRIITRLLALESGIEAVVEVDNKGATPVFRAAKRGKFLMLNRLFKSRMSFLINTDQVKNGLFLAACSGGWCSLANWLYNLIGSLKQTDSQWAACLVAASAGGHVQMLLDLISKPEGMSLEGNASHLIFLAAGRSRDLSVADYLMHQLPSGETSSSLELTSDMLATASAQGHVHILRHILSQFPMLASASRLDRWGNLPCHVAAICNQPNVLQELLLKHHTTTGSGSTQWEGMLTSVPVNDHGRSLLHLVQVFASLNVKAESLVEFGTDNPEFYRSLGSPPKTAPPQSDARSSNVPSTLDAESSTNAEQKRFESSRFVFNDFSHTKQPFRKKWTKIRRLGKGAFGVVHAIKTDKNITCAVKIIKPQFNDQQTEAEKEANREKLIESERNLCELQHENIVTFLHLERHRKNKFAIFMELVDGCSLKDFIQGNRLTDSEIKGFTKQICKALDYLHSKSPSIIHRDINGRNIMVLSDGERIKLIDFGLSIKLQDSQTFYNSSSVIPKGVLNFMAPELLGVQDDAGPCYCPESDIWALGCTIYHMVTGFEPHCECRGLLQITKRIADNGALPLPSGCSEELVAFYNCCVCRDRTERKSARELLDHSFLANHKEQVKTST